MRDDPGLDHGNISACLRTHYALDVLGVSYLPIGYDLNAFVYRVETATGERYFLKARRGPVDEAALAVPKALRERGIPNILAPLPTQTGDLWCTLNASEGCTIVLYPFIDGEDAMVAGMSAEQWRVFGETLQAVHGSGLETDLRDRIPSEAFTLPSGALVERVSSVASSGPDATGIAARFAEFWCANQEKIDQTLARARELGRSLRTKRFDHVLCHTDIHAANILVARSGEIFLIDWDGPMIAPRERDLFLVVGSRVARRVEPHEEDRFFEAYGPVELDPDALAYFRYERILQDLGEFGQSIFLASDLGADARQAEVNLATAMIVPGGDIDRAEVLPRLRFPAK